MSIAKSNHPTAFVMQKKISSQEKNCPTKEFKFDKDTDFINFK